MGDAEFFNSNHVESAYIILDPETGSEKRMRLIHWLEEILPFLNWRFHIFLMDQGESSATIAIEQFIALLSRFLERNRLAIGYLHPVVQMNSFDMREQKQWDRLLAPTKSFQLSAYHEQNEVRFLVSPVIEPAPEMRDEDVRQAISFFNARFAIPGIHIRGEQSGKLVSMTSGHEIRYYIDSVSDKGDIASQFWINHLFETILDRTADADEEATLLCPCRGHLVVDEGSGGVFTCFKKWEKGEPSYFIDTNNKNREGLYTRNSTLQAYCPGCIGRSIIAMRGNLEANDRENEGRQVFSKLGLAFSGMGEYGIGAKLARHAYELSKQDGERIAALIQEGLCYLELNSLDKAEETFMLAGKFSSDHGIVAYHRGLIQFARIDYAGALNWFEEAEESGSGQLSSSDVSFRKALCCINMERYGDARTYLERHLVYDSLKQSASFSFYQGVCDYGECRLETAIDHFRHALTIWPSEENPGRVFFYLGACLKEMGRFDEAILEIKKAVEADPEEAANHNLLGYCFYMTKQHEEAVKCFQRAVQINPGSAIDWASLGSNLRELGRIEEAIDMYEKALSLDPTMEIARTNLVTLRKN